IHGNAGFNCIRGGAGNDSLFGFGGNDRIEGQQGNDHLYGGTGVDRFIFRERSAATDGIDRIYDFTDADKIVIDTVAATVTTQLKAYQFTLGTSAADTSDRVIYDQATGAVRFDADGSGSKAAVLIAVLNTKPPVTFADFEFI
ncbi:MAG: calcium-binding protein, partial [Hyphomicrobium sp.]